MVLEQEPKAACLPARQVQVLLQQVLRRLAGRWAGLARQVEDLPRLAELLW